MKGNMLKNAMLILGMFAGFSVEAQTPSSTASQPKDATEIVINAQQNASNWFRAESQHFIVYSDTKQEQVNQLLNKLERFDYLLRLYSNIEKPADVQPKLTLYYQSRIKDLNEIDKDQPPYAIGLYTSCAKGVQAFGSHMYYGVNDKIPLEKQPEMKVCPTFLKPMRGIFCIAIPICAGRLGTSMDSHNILQTHVFQIQKRL